MRHSIVLLAVLLAACGPRILDPRPASAVATPVERVTLLDARKLAAVLPGGLSLDDTQKDKKGRIRRALVVEAPWERVQDLSLEAEFGALGLFSDDEIALALRQEAARLGAEVLVLLPHAQGVALRGSLPIEVAVPTEVPLAQASPVPGTPPSTRAVVVLEQEARRLGFSLSGQPAQLALAAPKALEFAVKRGACFALVLALEPEARVRPELSFSVKVEQRPPLARRGTAQPFELVEQKFTERRRVAAELGCALSDGTVSVSFDLPFALGSGSALASLAELTVSDHELKQLAHRHRELLNLRTSEAAEDKNACALCDDALEGFKGRHEDFAPWRACLKLNGLKASDCP